MSKRIFIFLNIVIFFHFLQHTQATSSSSTIDPFVSISNLSRQEAQQATQVDLQAFLSPTDYAKSGLKSSYAGYVTVDSALVQNMTGQAPSLNYFFWFFESVLTTPNNADTLPIILWLQGGPGCSSMLALTMESGPFRIPAGGFSPEQQRLLQLNPFAWTEIGHMLFIDNPVGSGYSFSSSSSSSSSGFVTDNQQMAAYLNNVLEQFLTIFPYRGDLFVAGESYAGKWIPALVAWVATHPSIVSQQLTGFAIGDGFTNPLAQTLVQSNQWYQIGLIDELQRLQAEQMQAQIVAAIGEGNFNQAREGRNAMFDWFSNVTGGVNAYDYRIYHPYDYAPTVNFMNHPLTKQSLHVPNALVVKEMCSADVETALNDSIMQSVADLLPPLLEQYQALFYQGQFDARDGVPSYQAVIERLRWRGIYDFLTSDRKVWYDSANPLLVNGYIRHATNLTQAVVIGAGHLVPMDQPQASLDLFSRWIAAVSAESSSNHLDFKERKIQFF